MNADELTTRYCGYIECLNKQDWDCLVRYVSENVSYNEEPIGLNNYRSMLKRDFRAIPDLYFEVALLISQPPYVASRLKFDCTPTGVLFGLPVNGKNVQFEENVFYKFDDGKIRSVWSVIDKNAIASQI